MASVPPPRTAPLPPRASAHPPRQSTEGVRPRRPPPRPIATTNRRPPPRKALISDGRVGAQGPFSGCGGAPRARRKATPSQAPIQKGGVCTCSRGSRRGRADRPRSWRARGRRRGHGSRCAGAGCRRQRTHSRSWGRGPEAAGDARLRPLAQCDRHLSPTFHRVSRGPLRRVSKRVA